MDSFTLISLELNATPTTLGSDNGTVMNAIYNSEGGSGVSIDQEEYMSDEKELHLYLRVTCLIFLTLIFTVGTVGNTMVTLVIGSSRDMRTSTNIFLVNLSIADLLVLLVCTPTALIEMLHHPDRWILGFYLCKFVPLLEAIVANASVLTILAISFERFYAICRPLRANYICTKSRAVCISVTAWVLASFITSPMILMITYTEGKNEFGEWTARCEVMAGSLLPDTYTISTIILCFLLPFVILLLIYGMIANQLTMEDERPSCNNKNENLKARKQVVIMLGSVCVTFFLCLLPFRVLTLFVILTDHKIILDHQDAYHNFVYFSRIMLYLNSSLNPILYNIMSSKFRNGFLRLCNRRRKPSPFTRNGTFLTNTTTTNSANMSINLGHQSGLGKGGSVHTSPELNGSMIRKNGVNRMDGKTLKNYLLKSQSHGSANGFLISHRAPGVLYNGIGTTTTTNNVKLPKQFDSSSSSTPSNCTATTFTGPMSVKSDLLYSAYIPGRRSETVL